jgi:hypothetical protein
MSNQSSHMLHAASKKVNEIDSWEVFLPQLSANGHLHEQASCTYTMVAISPYPLLKLFCISTVEFHKALGSMCLPLSRCLQIALIEYMACCLQPRTLEIVAHISTHQVVMHKRLASSSTQVSEIGTRLLFLARKRANGSHPEMPSPAYTLPLLSYPYLCPPSLAHILKLVRFRDFEPFRNEGFQDIMCVGLNAWL